MDPQTSRAKMRRQIDRVRKSKLSDVYRWSLQTKGLTVFVDLHPRRNPQKSYLLRISFEDFPRQAPSYVFVNRESKELTPDAWPPNVKHGAEPPGICTPGTREFYSHYHKNDARYPWNHTTVTVLDTLQRIQQMMEAGDK